MPETAKHFKLNREPWYDGRLDTQLSTHAALDYLEYLYERFNHDWLLAIAAYNSGESRVLAAIKKNRKAKKSTDFWSLKLPKETTNYVPRLFSLVEIAKKEGTKKWPVIANKANTVTVDIGQTLKLPVLEPIPLTINYQISPFIMRSAPPEKIKVSVNYIVKPGDTLWKISRLYHVSHRELAEWNQLNSQAALKLGKKLTIWLEQTPSVPTQDSPSQNSLLTNPTLLLQKVTSINPI